MNGAGVVVTGASRGIGRAVAELLAREGARLLLVARTPCPLDELARVLHATSMAVDVSEESAVMQLAARAREVLGEVTAVVHAAGAFELAPVVSTSVTSFDRALAVNLRSAFLLMRNFIPEMQQRGRGHFISIGSIAGRQAFPHNGAYSASKFGLRGLHAVLAAELRGSGVKSTLIEPSATDTSLWDDIDPALHPGLPPRTSMLSATAVADAVLYALTSPQDAAVHNIILDRN